jgi:hypothetical protein
MGSWLGEPAISLRVRVHDEPGIEIRVNFGVFAGRHATPAEIEELALALRELTPAFAIVAEDRHVFGGSAAAAVHQVVIEVPHDSQRESDVLAEKIVLIANGWALDCIASRHGAGEL